MGGHGHGLSKALEECATGGFCEFSATVGNFLCTKSNVDATF